MGRVQSNIGLITGINIGTTVDALMKLAGKRRDMLQEQTDTLKKEQAAITELSAYLLAARYVSDNLGKEDLFSKQKASTSDDRVLAATVTGQPAAGTYQFTPLRMAQRDQLLSSGFDSESSPIGAGQLTFRFGDNVQRSAGFDLFGGGAGVAPGRIRIADRSGAIAEIDLSAAQSLDDVLEAINGNTTINVTAVASGDHIRLIDHTGQTRSHLMVQEVGRGTTAASLGLAGIDVEANTADGQDMLRLTEGTALASLNDGNGVQTSSVFPEIQFRLRDGTTGFLDFSKIKPGTSTVQKETTLGEILKVFNEAKPGKLKAEIGPDGTRVIVTDLTEGSGDLQLTSLYGSGTLHDLGLDGHASGGVLTGRRLIGGMQTVLLSTLGGGKGLGQLGTLALTDRSGASATVDLAQAETLEDVINAINAAGAGITARVNDARNGILLADTTGQSGPLIVANGDQTNTADKLCIAVDAARASVNSGDLHQKVVSHRTKLSQWNGGVGVARGRVSIHDSTGRQATLDLSQGSVQTIGDVIQAISRLNLQVVAEINETGDGIRIRDTGHGSGKLSVADLDSTAAADLHLTRSAVTEVIGGEETQVVDGSITQTIQIGSQDTLDSLRQKIEALKAGVTAKTFVDGSSRPYRLSLTSQASGKASQLVIDTSQAGFSFQEISRGEDALLMLGARSAAGSNVILSSPTNQFADAVPGVKLEVKQASSTQVTVSVDQSNVDLLASVKTLVDNYNRFRKKLNEDTAYDVEQNKSSVLTGDTVALQLDTELSYLLSGRFTGSATIESLGQLGITMSEDGTLAYEEATLKARFAEDPQGVKDFFTHADTGFSAKFKELTERLTGEDLSLLAQRFKGLDRRISENQDKIDFMTKRLDDQQERLYLEFYRMELAVSKLKTQMSYLDAIQPIDWSTTSSSSTS